MKIRVIWTKEKVIEDAKKYTGQNEWAKKSPGAYQWTWRHKCFHEVAPHLVRKTKRWTDEEIIAEAKKYKSKSEWEKNSLSSYEASRRHNIHDLATSHMLIQRKSWDKKKIIEDAKLYMDVNEWSKKSPGAVNAAHSLGIYYAATAHMIRKFNNWTDEEIFADAKLYSQKIDWLKNSPKYQVAYTRGLLDKACKHMVPSGNRYKRQIYAIENLDNSVYIGLSYNPQRRYKAHVKPDADHPCSKILFKHFTNGTQKLKIFEQFYSQKEAQEKEAEYIEKYRNDGWTILNAKKAGALGMPIKKHTRESCAELAKGCLDKGDFRLKYPNAFQAICKWGWHDIISHLPNRKRQPYTEEEIHAAALQCKTRIEFIKRFPGHYRAAQPRGILEKVTNHLPSIHNKPGIQKRSSHD